EFLGPLLQAGEHFRHKAGRHGRLKTGLVDSLQGIREVEVTVLHVVDFFGQSRMDGTEYLVHMAFPSFLALLEVLGDELLGCVGERLLFTSISQPGLLQYFLDKVCVRLGKRLQVQMRSPSCMDDVPFSVDLHELHPARSDLSFVLAVDGFSDGMVNHHQDPWRIPHIRWIDQHGS
ncbi:hypothetical protein DPQ33_19780, partial [Oceanidesulfovibrio indonesiensis]